MDEIVRLLWQRDEQALTMMQQQYGGLCYTILTEFLHIAQDAEEALNDVLLQIWNVKLQNEMSARMKQEAPK